MRRAIARGLAAVGLIATSGLAWGCSADAGGPGDDAPGTSEAGADARLDASGDAEASLDAATESAADAEQELDASVVSDAVAEVAIDAEVDAAAGTDADATDDAATEETPDAPLDAQADADAAPYAPFVFSVTGDVPYTAAESTAFDGYIAQLNQLSTSRALLHVGDIKSGASACVESVYATVAAQLLTVAMPVVIVPGDNEWNDCTDPAQAWTYWLAYLGEFEKHWASAPALDRQAARHENVAWTERGVAMVGVNLVGGRVQDAAEWATRLADDAAWVDERLSGAAPDVYAAVVFAQALPTSAHQVFFGGLRASSARFARPVLYVHGDGHAWIEDRPWPEQNILRVQIEMGGKAPPLEVTVSPTVAGAFSLNRTPFP